MGLNPRRGRSIKAGKPGRGPVVYWMSREQRTRDNWPLLFAQERAVAERCPLLVVFCLVNDFPGANLRHYRFLLKGLKEVAESLAAHNIAFRLLPGDPGKTLPALLESLRARLLVTDFDPLRIKRLWKEAVAGQVGIPALEVDGHNLVPSWFASDKREYAAATFRPKMRKRLPEFFTEFPPLRQHLHGRADALSPPVDWEELDAAIPDRTVPELPWITAGEAAAQAALARFLREGLPRYAADRNDPCRNGQSGLSPYLHFGQLAPQRVALAVDQARSAPENKEAFLEELVVRRELADNFCWHAPDYDQTAAFPDWARRTLDAHRRDPRPALYSREQFDRGDTHEELWNSCQQDLRQRGKLHGYLRMYWAKKILEWSPSPEEALATAIFLNDRYSLDGRDPSGFTGIAWSIGGVHDRAWAERPVFGKVRFMNLAGCRAKFRVDDYIRSVREAAATPPPPLASDRMENSGT